MGRSSPSSLESLRQANRLRVMSLLQQKGHASRADLVRSSGLSRTTVSSLVAELLQEGLVVERSEWGRRSPSPDGGRPATLLTLDPGSGAFLGIDFAHEVVRVVVVDRCGELLAEASELHRAGDQPEAALELAAELARRVTREAQVDGKRVRGAGVAVSAPLRFGKRTAFASASIFNRWADLEVEPILGERLGCPVHVGNDANLGLLAECTFGAGREVENALYVMLSAGVGLGLWLQGALFTGEAGTAGELGHVVVDGDGQICRCGNRGCLETVAGAGWLARSLSYARGEELDVEALLELVARGDAGARRLVSDAGRAVGGAVATACMLLDPGLIIVGGELAEAGEELLGGIREMIDRDTSPATGRSYAVVRGTLGRRAEALGAATLAMDTESRQMAASPGQPR